MRISSAERKQHLIKATVALMRAKGVQSLNLRAIATEAGASLATVYYCFDSKEDLLSNAVEYWLRRMVEIPDTAKTNKGPLGLVKTVLRIAEEYWTNLVNDPQDVLGQIELVLWAVRQSSSDALAKRIYERYMATLGDIFTNAVAVSGETSTWDPQELARAFISLVDGASLQFIADPTATGHRERFFRALLLILADSVDSDRKGREGELGEEG